MKLTVAKRPCGSCPYRRDVPSGVWAQNEYDKLPAYDGPMHLQDPRQFGCHQRDGHLCAGWLACHGDLLAIRIAAALGKDTSEVENYTTDVPVFASGAEARAHGMKGIKRPGKKARKLVAKLERIIK